MTADELLALPEPPPDTLGPAIQALWWAEHGGWDKAHDRAQSDDGKPAAWVHAYLHREEGDHENAAYWYARAGRPIETGPLDQERRAIAAALLAG